MSRVRFAIIGAGGVGGHLAARLGAAGNAVSVLARGAHLAAIRERGLTLRTPGDEVTIRPEASDRGADLPAADVVVFAVKGQDLAAAADTAAPLMKGGAVALPILNGVEATGILAERFGADRALIGIARISAFIEGPGVVVQATPFASYILGAPDGRQDDPRVTPIRAAFEGAGIKCIDSADVRVDLWKKFAMLTAFAGTTAGARCDGATVAATPELRALYLALSREVVALAQAEGIAVPDTMPEEGLKFLESLAPGVRASMAHDLAAGKRLELDWLNGAVPRLGARHGLAATAHATVTALLAPYRDGKG